VKVAPTALPDVLLVEPEVHRDARGWLLEAWRADRVPDPRLPASFAQDNLVESAPGVLRGLHLQHPDAQGKLVQVLAGEIFDVAVDLRPDSPTFRRWVSVPLSAREPRLLWIPPGFGHGYAVTGSVPALVLYRCTAPWRREAEVVVRYDDPELGVRWPLARPLLSSKDAAAPRLAEIDPARLPRLAAPGGGPA
jgi:dTDP-4-dehydrorhamnose 3,5-epimerase